MYQKNIEEALKATNPIDALRLWILELNSIGSQKQEIYNILYDYSLQLMKDNRENEAELLEDVMDMITGWYVGKNLDLKR